jgi:hypothetical protein
MNLKNDKIPEKITKFVRMQFMEIFSLVLAVYFGFSASQAETEPVIYFYSIVAILSVYSSIQNRILSKLTANIIVKDYLDIILSQIPNEPAGPKLFYVLGIKNTFKNATVEFIIKHHRMISRNLKEVEIARRIVISSKKK